jgi:hypothetical protein
MKQWEYIVVPLTNHGEHPGLWQDKLRDLGTRGWQLVSVDQRIAYMKRELIRGVSPSSG